MESKQLKVFITDGQDSKNIVPNAGPKLEEPDSLGVQKNLSPEEIKNLLDDLLEVGPKKPLGYLPIDTITDLCKTDPETLEKDLVARGLKVLTLNKHESNVESLGALFAYDEAALRDFLYQNRDTLIDANWPIKPEAFIRHLKVSVRGKTKLFDLIADVYGDKTNPGRTDVEDARKAPVTILVTNKPAGSTQL